jgi:1-phosphofructokinase family hexose kinase
MIFSITPNPALDLSGTVKEIIPNEKSYVSDEKFTPGGNGINAAIIIHRLGEKVAASGFLGGSTGEEIKKMLEEEGVPTEFVFIPGRTRTNMTISSQKTHKQTRLSFAGPTVAKKDFSKLKDKVKALPSHSVVLIGGSLPQGITPSDISSLIKTAKKAGHLVMIDMPGKILKELSSEGAFFIKPNLIEFQEMMGKKVESIQSILPLARKLNDKIPLICISSVEGGALLVTKQRAFWGKIPKVKIRSTVGAGDSMVGAIAAKLDHFLCEGQDEEECLNERIEDLLRSGLSAACATLINSGMDLGEKKTMELYYPKIIIKEV